MVCLVELQVVLLDYGVTTGVLGVTAGLLGVTTGLLGVTGATGGVGVTTFLELANTQSFPSLVRKYW